MQSSPTPGRFGRSRADSGSSQASAGYTQGGAAKCSPSNTRKPASKRSNILSDTSPEDGDDEEGDDEDDDSDDEDGDVLAPSGGTAFKRGHQTGLSVSLSNTSLGKRGRTPSIDDNEERPMSKRSKTDGDAESSDDDAYNAVDDISDSDGEKAVEHGEEQVIIESEDDNAVQQKRGSFSSVDSFFGLIGDDGANLIFPDPPAFFDEQMANTDTVRRNSVLRDDTETAAPTRRVRFAEEVQHYASSSNGTESEEDEVSYHPDIFLQQDSLAPGLRRLIEERDDAGDSDGEGSYWDFENEDRVVEELDDEESGSESGSSGYETDEGETTDEDFTVPATIKRPDFRLNKFGNSRLNVPTTPTTTPVKRSLAAARKGPVMGSFVVDEHKPIAVVDGHGKHMLFFPAPKHRRRQAGSPAQTGTPGPSRDFASAQNQSENESDIGFAHADPMLSSPANAMVSGFYNGRAGHGPSGLSSQIVGPTEAFYPFVSMDSSGLIETDENDAFDDLFSEDEDLNIEDFINFDDADSSDDENDEQTQEQEEDPSSNSAALEEDDDVEKTPQPTSKFKPVKARSPSTPTPNTSGSLLAHFDRGIASSFRRNADRHKSWTRSPIAAGIKGGRFEMANNPISPMRRRRGMSATTSSQLHRMNPMQTAAVKSGSVSHGEQLQFGGPLKKRIQNANQMRIKKNRKNTL